MSEPQQASWQKILRAYTPQNKHLSARAARGAPSKAASIEYYLELWSEPQRDQTGGLCGSAKATAIAPERCHAALRQTVRFEFAVGQNKAAATGAIPVEIQGRKASL